MNHKSNEKMDIGDLGFIIIAFIVFIVNFIVKSNKEKIEAQQQEQEQKTAIPDIPELEPWDEDYPMPPFFDTPAIPKKSVGGDKKVSESFIPVSDSIKSIEERIKPSFEGMSSISESLFKEDSMESVSYQDEETQGDVSYTNELFHGNITEELKKGIIYSEILHRKYE
ncbi:MAG: hypothetical protein GX921_09955 [Bacteroidales bacterium]|nr:hypothetical protein [Bacteroidales bacterium]